MYDRCRKASQYFKILSQRGIKVTIESGDRSLTGMITRIDTLERWLNHGSIEWLCHSLRSLKLRRSATDESGIVRETIHETIKVINSSDRSLLCQETGYKEEQVTLVTKVNDRCHVIFSPSVTWTQSKIAHIENMCLWETSGCQTLCSRIYPNLRLRTSSIGSLLLAGLLVTISKCLCLPSCRNIPSVERSRFKLIVCLRGYVKGWLESQVKLAKLLFCMNSAVAGILCAKLPKTLISKSHTCWWASEALYRGRARL